MRTGIALEQHFSEEKQFCHENKKNQEGDSKCRILTVFYCINGKKHLQDPMINRNVSSIISFPGSNHSLHKKKADQQSRRRRERGGKMAALLPEIRWPSFLHLSSSLPPPSAAAGRLFPMQ